MITKRAGIRVGILYPIISEISNNKGMIRPKITTNPKNIKVKSPPTNNLEAYNLVLEARKLSVINVQENKKAISLLERAIDLDPGFSMAYFGIGFRF